MDNKKYANGMISGSSLNAALDKQRYIDEVLHPLNALRRNVRTVVSHPPVSPLQLAAVVGSLYGWPVPTESMRLCEIIAQRMNNTVTTVQITENQSHREGEVKS